MATVARGAAKAVGRAASKASEEGGQGHLSRGARRDPELYVLSHKLVNTDFKALLIHLSLP